MRKLNKKLLLVAILGVLTFGAVGCMKPYDTPEFVTIEASQTAFLIPLTGDTSDQASFASEELLEQAKVATKEVQIPHRWVQTGRWKHEGQWRPSAKLIVVERKPVSRMWASGDTPETSGDAIWGGTNDGVGVYVGMNCSAQINEEDATKFLYRYNNTSLEYVIDNEIKNMVRDEFNKETRKYSSTELNAHKTDITDAVKTKVTEYFKEYGITIIVLGTNEDFSYENSAIQKAIDDKFISEQALVKQQNENAVALAKAEADATAIKIQAEAEAEAAKIKAENDAEVAKITANAEAEVLRIQSEAEATANKKISESLTDYIIQKMHADNERIMWENWNGIAPYIFGADNVNPFLNMGE